ncbi:hypothetical protein GPALN_003686 [Globodera pallida]|uniref:Zinc finger protein ZPR1 n=1 Tax=Globodera pallida TaxID=36090 RepID=A0A183BWQ9_GLOPA|nr:hypothetical protein GPALN_003686 [Globodera pallida]
MDDVEQPLEVVSVCPSCLENGITKMIVINIPFYQRVIVMSFNCDHCGHHNSNLQPGEQAQEFGTEIVLKVQKPDDLNRTIVRSEYGNIEIPELELTIPANSASGGLTTVEGVVHSVIQDLQHTQHIRRSANQEMADKIDNFIQQLSKLLLLDFSWTLKLRDPSGHCFIQNPDPFHVDPRCITSHYYRSLEEDKVLGFIDDYAFEKQSKQLTEDDIDDREWNSYDDVKSEVLHFAAQCSACGSPSDTRMKSTDIPYFQTVIIMSSDCDHCGFKSNEVKSGGATQENGCKLTLRIEENVDLVRDLLKSDTCQIIIPDLEIEMGQGVLPSRFTTVEGLISAVKEQLERQAPFFLGDSATEGQRKKFRKLLDKLSGVIQLKERLTLILDDPAGNSYIQSLTAHLEDERLQKEFYTRTHEQNEELGLNDMKVYNYGELETLDEVDELIER